MIFHDHRTSWMTFCVQDFGHQFSIQVVPWSWKTYIIRASIFYGECLISSDSRKFHLQSTKLQTALHRIGRVFHTFPPTQNTMHLPPFLPICSPPPTFCQFSFRRHSNDFSSSPFSSVEKAPIYPLYLQSTPLLPFSQSHEKTVGDRHSLALIGRALSLSYPFITG